MIGSEASNQAPLSEQSSLNRNPAINLAQLREERYSRHRSQRVQSRSRQHRLPRRQLYGQLVLPKTYKFVCIAQNGSDGPAEMPRKTTNYYTRLLNHHMIVEITFDHGEPSYCRQRILESFAHLPLIHFQFYRATGNSKFLSPQTRFTEEQFDLSALQE